MPATTLIIDDDPAYARSLARLVKREGFITEVALSGEEALERAGEMEPELAIVDLALPGIDGIQVIRELKREEPAPVCIAISGSATVEAAVAAMHAGAFDFLTKSSELEEIQFKLRKALEVADLRRKVQYFMDRERQERSARIVGESAAMKRLFRQIEEIAAAPETTVLVLGETGTGKELVARAIHDLSERREHPMVSVNCTAVPGPLLESEFFGHERGAFTGADRTKQGLVELAGDGSLFLDEIGDLDLGLQGKLLRLIEERRFKRIGGNHEIRANVRFIAATNRDLRAMVAADRFREDLLYRLDVYQIQLPPLRERDGDVPLLARHFIQQFNVQMKKEVEDLGEDAAAALVRYDFPGNVRQLRNLVEQAMITAHGRWLTLDRFQGLQLSGHESVTRSGRDAGAGAGLQHEPAGAAADGPLDQQLAAVRATEQELWEREVAIIQEALARSDGKKSQAAELLGISRFALQRRLRRMNDHSG